VDIRQDNCSSDKPEVAPASQPSVLTDEQLEWVSGGEGTDNPASQPPQPGPLPGW